MEPIRPRIVSYYDSALKLSRGYRATGLLFAGFEKGTAWRDCVKQGLRTRRWEDLAPHEENSFYKRMKMRRQASNKAPSDQEDVPGAPEEVSEDSQIPVEDSERPTQNEGSSIGATAPGDGGRAKRKTTRKRK
ncbi:hypothetical protein M427DRAFT_54630 [Gonapodya prolifera JEL478]|uniref:Uncharacterized protein n=1 Tax=Gonapodya prolifera (strain JEL478) TaxID=1344416 RepID=A0A139ALG7_GONPJ|nr:hypothetical protein M427DRAFT_54630 [Gonapodya prolifera JEL478]|eukprot:KXS17343.1 hypothetical protein M427DRAFT_54630 [Gonapodya prolifera JEL478]